MISSSSQAKGAPLRECEERVVRIYLQMCEVKEDVLVKEDVRRAAEVLRSETISPAWSSQRNTMHLRATQGKVP
jgi:hypothetical protein